jgi:hypothetical protein
MTLSAAEAEMALVAIPAAIRTDEEKPVEQEFKEASSSGSPDVRAFTDWTTGGSSEEKHVLHPQTWPRLVVYAH